MGKGLGLGRTATTAVRDGEQTEIAYHGTKVVIFDEHKIVLNTGGYLTNTTKRRMNEASDLFGLGYRVYAVKRLWHVTYGGKEYPYLGDTLSLDRQAGVVYGVNDTTYGVNYGRVSPVNSGDKDHV